MLSEEALSKKPIATQFHQQTLRSCNPLILMSTVFPFFAGIGTLFIVIGISLLMVSLSVKEVSLDYTYCNRSGVANGSVETCSSIINRNATSRFERCTCVISFEINSRFNGQVYLYYLVHNLYQNHRRYVKSMDSYQLSGRQVVKVTSDCEPYGSVQNGSYIANYAPCGIIANSIFNDTFSLNYIANGTTYGVPMTSRGIAWKVDTDILYGRPSNWNNTLKPVNWPKTALERNNKSYSGDEELLVWMRTSSFSDFKKLHRIIEHNEAPFVNGLPPGQYELIIEYAYPVTMFNGRKSVVLSTTSFLGGKNNNMGIMYLIIGTLQLFIAFIFALQTFVLKNRKTSLSDMPLIECSSSSEHYGVSE